MRRGAAAVIGLTAFMLAQPVAAQTTFGGQVRPRFETRTGSASQFVSMRTRAHLAHAFEHGGLFVQLQDVRLWGEEASTMDAAADALDVHQGFAWLGDDARWLRLGRQEIGLGGERLIGAVDWAQQARGFDGLRGRLPLGPVVVDAFGAQLAEEATGAAPLDRELAGVHLSTGGPALEVQVHSIADGGDAWRWTHGARALGALGGWSWRAEANVQRGALASMDVAAWMAGLRLARAIGPVTPTLWIDYLSGDDDPADGVARVFDTLYATNHKFYGYADLFTNVPQHTGGRGLVDLALKLSGQVERVGVELAGHAFRAAAADGLDSARFGEEVDLVASYPLSTDLVVSGGGAWVDVGPALRQLRGFDSDRWFGYLMVDARF